MGCRMEILKCMHIILKLKSSISGGKSVSFVLHAGYAYFNVLIYIRRVGILEDSSDVLAPLSHTVQQPQGTQSEFLSDEIKP